ncbi:MAG: hypothetical protein IAF38_04535 [Bacteroidia bacterium]|nr:hypothetical protein [Bacteroidia bacterium]
MKRIAIYILLIFFSKECLAKYARIYLPSMLEHSEVIVYGKIISIDSLTIRIVSLDKVKGNNIKDTVEILKFMNWTCAHRYSKYEAGQEAIFFLVLNEQNKFKVMGSGNEGELTVSSNTAYYPDYGQKKFKSKIFTFFSSYEKCISMNVPTCIDGIKLYFKNLESIEKQLNIEKGRAVYTDNSIAPLPKNMFLEIIMDQKRTMS